MEINTHQLTVLWNKLLDSTIFQNNKINKISYHIHIISYPWQNILNLVSGIGQGIKERYSLTLF